MATTATQIRDAADSEILARIQANSIERYTLADGRQVTKSPLGDLLKVRAEFASEARAEENDSSISIFRYF